MVEIDNFASYTQPHDSFGKELDLFRDLAEAPKRGRAQIINHMDPYVSKIRGVKNSWSSLKRAVNTLEEIRSYDEDQFETDDIHASARHIRFYLVNASIFEVSHDIELTLRNLKNANADFPQLENDLLSLLPAWIKHMHSSNNYEVPTSFWQNPPTNFRLSDLLFRLNSLSANKSKGLSELDYCFVAEVLSNQMRYEADINKKITADKIVDITQSTAMDMKAAVKKYGKGNLSNGLSYLQAINKFIIQTYDSISDPDDTRHESAIKLFTNFQDDFDNTKIGEMLAYGYYFRQTDDKIGEAIEYARDLRQVLQAESNPMIEEFYNQLLKYINNFSHIAISTEFSRILEGDLQTTPDDAYLLSLLSELKSTGLKKIEILSNPDLNTLRLKNTPECAIPTLIMKGSVVEVSIKISSEEYPPSTLVFFLDLSDQNLPIYPFIVDPENVTEDTASTLKMLIIKCLESHQDNNLLKEEPKETPGKSYIVPPARNKGKSHTISRKRKTQKNDPQSIIPSRYMDEQITQKYRPHLVCSEDFWDNVRLPDHIKASVKLKIENYNLRGEGTLKAMVTTHKGPEGEKVYSLRDGKYRILAYKTSGGKAIIYDVDLRKNLYNK